MQRLIIVFQRGKSYKIEPRLTVEIPEIHGMRCALPNCDGALDVDVALLAVYTGSIAGIAVHSLYNLLRSSEAALNEFCIKECPRGWNYEYVGSSRKKKLLAAKGGIRGIRMLNVLPEPEEFVEGNWF